MYRKELFVYEGDRPVRAVIRNYREEDFEGLIEVQQECFPPPFPSELWWNREQLSNHVNLFPEGALCVEIDGRIAGSMTGLLTEYHVNDPDHTWEDVTDNGYIRNHNPQGNTLYVVDIAVRPAYRKLGLGKWLMFAMYDVVVHLGLERLLGGGRMPGYGSKAEEMSAEQYVEAVLNGSLKDPVLSFLLRCGRMPVKVVPGYLEDEQSRNYGTLMEWRNPCLTV
ncbi:GNAT family N-acetyltransferase [Paenibacillus sambharensis]|uniref:GNAT family N-acetyltransferase n=1 Tax=Paenibacillus sambharensis TaxID=1803190 RepID=A0A2W1LFF6_9BACL|nr:GNAT family N-acetyltransferase [Paenibacillus sambharensis]PZD93785.1 GNAT family N-acetyltransferase [Paenibacillus sambharensis]